MTAPRHAAVIRHPHLKDLAQLAKDVLFLARTGWVFLWHHMPGVLATLVASVVVTVLAFTFVAANAPVVGVYVVLVGTVAIAGVVAYKASGSTK